MKYLEFLPNDLLRHYVKCFYIYETGSDIFTDTAFATGCIEIMFNIGSGGNQIKLNGDFVNTPKIELWGQVIRPLQFRSMEKCEVFGVRFYPHGAALFLNEDISQFNNQVVDFSSVAGNTVKLVYQELLESKNTHDRIGILEKYLLKRFLELQKKLVGHRILNDVVNQRGENMFPKTVNELSSQHRRSVRYIQKVFLENTGLTPKLYFKINRFQKSLHLLGKRTGSLTDIAHDCGYFDQSHFIRDFKFFTGLTPSDYNPSGSSALLVS